jgi:hypothetical protein
MSWRGQGTVPPFYGNPPVWDRVAALSFNTVIDDPSGCRRSRDVAGHFGLTGKRLQWDTSIDNKSAQ